MSSSDSEDDYDLEYLEAESIEEKGTGRTGKRVIWANGFSYTYNSDSRKQEGVSFFHCTRQKTANRRGKRKRCKARGFVWAGQNIFFLSKRCFHDEEETNQCWNGNGGTVSNSENQIGSEISSVSIKRGAGDELLAAFPKDSSISRQIQRKKYKLNLKTVDCKKLCDMVIPPGAKVTHDEKPFLRYDSQVLSGYFATQRVLVWMSDFGHSLLLRTELVGFDATYRKSPRGIYQFFTLYAWIDEKFFVVGFAWMCGKTTESYVSVMKNFFYESAHRYNVKGFFSDFESASATAIMKIFPTLKPVRCIFPLSKTIQKLAKSHGLAKYYAVSSSDGYSSSLS